MNNETLKFEISGKTLADTLGDLVKAIDAKCAVPSDDSYRFDVYENYLFVSSVGSAICAMRKIPAAEGAFSNLTGARGSFVLPRKQLAGPVDSLRSKTLTIERSEGGDVCTVRYAGGKFSVGTFDPAKCSEFRRRPENSEAPCVSLELPAGVLLRGLRNTTYAKAEDDAIVCLRGVHCTSAGRVITFVGTDRHIFSCCEFETETPGVPFECTIPPKVAEFILRTSKNTPGDERIRIEIDEKNIYVTSANSLISGLLFDGTFIDYARIFSRLSHTGRIFISKKNLLDATKRISMFVSEMFGGFTVRYEPDKVTISASNALYASDAVEEVPAVRSEGLSGVVEISYNVEEYERVLRNTAGDYIRIDIENPATPTYFENVEDPDEEIPCVHRVLLTGLVAPGSPCSR